MDRVNAFVTKYENSQPDFVKYFVDNWFNATKYRVWSRAFHQLEFSRMLTNNYIESWHKKLRTCFLGRSRNKRLDRLVYILTDDVEFYYKGEARRVITGSGPATKSQKQQRRIEMTAEAIPGHMRENMIISPTKSTMSDQDEGYDDPDFAEDGAWLVDSFTEENVMYKVEVANNVVRQCSCYSWIRYQNPCKHMHLLRLHIADFSFDCSYTGLLVSLDLCAADNNEAQQLANERDAEPISSNISTSASAISDRERILQNFSRAADISVTTRHSNEYLMSMSRYATLEESETLLSAYTAVMKAFQDLKAKYESHFFYF